MLMSQAAMAASSSGLPKCGVSAREMPVMVASKGKAIKQACLGVNMADLPAARHTPAGDGIVVLIGKGQNGRLFDQLTSRSHEFGAGRLHIAGLVPRPALQCRGAAIPSPRHAEAGESLALHRLLKCGLGPALSPIG